MTWATPTPTSPSAGDPDPKFGIAIGSGATLPSVTCNFVCAPASEGSSKLAAAPAPPIRMSRRFNGNEESENEVTGIAGSFFKNLNCETSAWGQNRCPCISTVPRSPRPAWGMAGPARPPQPRLRRRRRRRLGFRLRHRLFGVFRFQRLRDRIDLGRIRLLLDRLRLVLGLVLGDRLWRIGLFLDRLFHRLRRRFGRRSGHDFLLFHDLADGVFDPPGIRAFLHHLPRLVLFAGLDAGGDLGELI